MLSSLLSVFIAITLYFTLLPSALASSDKIQWQFYLLGIIAVSVCASLAIIRRKQAMENLGIKVIVAGTYFWIFTFAQLIVLAVAYQLLQ